MSANIRYQVNGNNSVLRLALRRVWRFQCYWCGTPTDWSGTQIDHIVPQALNGPRLAQLLSAHGIEQDFDVHGLANLAPICGRCNGPAGKGGRDLAQTPLVRIQLDRAARYASQVADVVHAFNNSNRLGEDLLRATEADLTADSAREAFKQLAPAVVQRLAFLAPDLVDYFAVERLFAGDHVVSLRLDNQGRKAMTVIDDVLEVDLSQPLESVLDDCDSDLRQETVRRMEAVEVPSGYMHVGEIDYSDLATTLTFTSCQRWDDVMTFEAEVKIDARYSCSCAHDAADGDGLVNRQGEAHILVDAALTLTWNVNHPGDAEYDVRVLSTDFDVFVE